MITDLEVGRQLLMESYALDDSDDLCDWFWDRKEEVFEALAALDRVKDLAYEWANATAAEWDDPKTVALHGRQILATLDGFPR